MRADDDASGSRLIWSSSAYSHVGMVRKVNEDSCLEQPSLGHGGLWAVADGMGGHEAGDVASRLIVETLAQQVTPAADMTGLVQQTAAALHTANRLIQQRAAADYQHRTIGSTVVVMLLQDDQVACLWAGDSRIYRLRNNELQQLTRDHSHVQEMIDRGLLDPRDAESHPMANVITRAVGSNIQLDIDQITLDARAGDVYLLCSDGLTKAVSDYEIAQLLTTSQTRHAVNSLINAALRRQADDNVTAIVIAIGNEDNNSGGETIPLELVNAKGE